MKNAVMVASEDEEEGHYQARWRRMLRVEGGRKVEISIWDLKNLSL